MKRTLPDFDTWADLLTDGYRSVKVSEALKQAFEQGYHLNTSKLGPQVAVKQEGKPWLDDWGTISRSN